MTLYMVSKNKIMSLCKIIPKDKATTPKDLEMFNNGYRFKLGDLTKWEAIAYFKNKEDGENYAKEKNWQEW